MDKERYQRYLCSREWSVKREAVRKRSHGICERCRENRMDAVHHLTYKRVYKELLSDLQAICNACHEFTHGKSDYDPAVPKQQLQLIKSKSISTTGNRNTRSSKCLSCDCNVNSDCIEVYIEGDFGVVHIGRDCSGQFYIGKSRCYEFLDAYDYVNEVDDPFMMELNEDHDWGYSWEFSTIMSRYVQ